MYASLRTIVRKVLNRVMYEQKGGFRDHEKSLSGICVPVSDDTSQPSTQKMTSIHRRHLGKLTRSLMNKQTER